MEQETSSRVGPDGKVYHSCDGLAPRSYEPVFSPYTTNLAPAVGAGLAVMERDAIRMRGGGLFVFAQVSFFICFLYLDHYIFSFSFYLNTSFKWLLFFFIIHLNFEQFFRFICTCSFIFSIGKLYLFLNKNLDNISNICNIAWCIFPFLFYPINWFVFLFLLSYTWIKSYFIKVF